MTQTKESTENLTEHLTASRKFEIIMDLYYKGEFGDKHLSIKEILKKAGEPNLLDEMTLKEIDEMIKTSTGFNKIMFILLKKKKMRK